MNITYRTGEIKDAPQIAFLINKASGGIVEFLFHDLIPEKSPIDVVAIGLQEEKSYFSFKNTIVAELNNSVIASVLSYPSSYVEITDELKNFIPQDRLDYIMGIYTANIPESLYIDAIAVADSYERKRIGSTLLSLTFEKAAKENFNKVSLIAFADNTRALQFYKHHGFEITAPIAIENHPTVPHQGGAFVLIKKI